MSLINWGGTHTVNRKTPRKGSSGEKNGAHWTAKINAINAGGMFNFKKHLMNEQGQDARGKNQGENDEFLTTPDFPAQGVSAANETVPGQKNGSSHLFPPKKSPFPAPPAPSIPAHPEGHLELPKFPQNFSQRRDIAPKTLASPTANPRKPPSFLICCWDNYIHVSQALFLIINFFPLLFFFPPAFCFTAPQRRGCDTW